MKTYRQLSEQFNDLTMDDERDLIARSQDGDLDAREQLVTSHIRLMRYMCLRYARNGITVDDLMGDAVIGFYKAIEKYNLKRHKMRLGTFAQLRIRTEVAKSEMLQGTIRIPYQYQREIRKVKQVQVELRETKQCPYDVIILSKKTSFSIERIKRLIFVMDNLMDVSSLDKTLTENFTLMDTIPA